jgi:heme-degrading monooxygenase HmoA
MTRLDASTGNISKSKTHAIMCISEFPGFYDSWLSQKIDDEQEQFVEYFWEDGERFEEYFSKSFVRDATGKYEQEIRDIMNEAFCNGSQIFDYDLCRKELAESWVQQLNHELSTEHLAPTLTYESMTSPRFYNYETDRVFVHIPWTQMEAIYEYVKGTEAFKTIITERFTNRPGFHSFYSNDVEVWTKKEPLTEWDHNELGAVLSAYVLDCVGRMAGCDLNEWWTEYVTLPVESFTAFDAAIGYNQWTDYVKAEWKKRKKELKSPKPALVAA